MTVLGESSPRWSIAMPGSDALIELAWGVATDVGHRRSANEDSAIVVPPVFSVADGMGGHAAGDLASAAAVEWLADRADGGFSDEDTVMAALTAAALEIDELAEGIAAGVGTTVTGAALTVDDGIPAFLVFNVGDSRVYRFERNELTRVTVDHSVVQELVDAGVIREQDAESHPESNVITRALGFGEAPRPDFTVLPLRVGLRLLICSDGLTKEVDAAHLRLHLAAGLTAQTTASALVDAALAAGGRDNVTVVVVDVLSMPSPTGS